MNTNEQAETIRFLTSPETYGVETVERIDTHISVVFLAGDRAYKLKRCVQFDYVDFSTAEKRHAACEAELAINRRMAPAFYLAVRAITKEADGALRFDGTGEAIDWVVEMVRFDQDALLDRLADRQAVDIGMMVKLGGCIAHLHATADRRSDHGGLAGMEWVVDGNERGFREEGQGILDPAACGRLTAHARDELKRFASLLESRRKSGFVRWCHGDLHLRNIFRAGGTPVLFDAVEFNPEIACVDVLYDLAFLLMDLWRRRLTGHANAVFNAYLSRTPGECGLGLLPLFLSCRAAVRAKTSATASASQDRAERASALKDAAREYLAMAEGLLQSRAPRIVAVGGLSGSGKSTLARGLAPEIGAVPGAVIVRSDVERKRLFGVPPGVRLQGDAYTTEISRRVYRHVTKKAVEIARTGHAAIVDAVFACQCDRAALADAAAEAGIPFTGLWLDAPAPLMAERLGRRVDDASDATPEVLQTQLGGELGQLDWIHVDAAGDKDQSLERARKALSPDVNSGN